MSIVGKALIAVAVFVTVPLGAYVAGRVVGPPPAPAPTRELATQPTQAPTASPGTGIRPHRLPQAPTSTYGASGGQVAARQDQPTKRPSPTARDADRPGPSPIRPTSAGSTQPVPTASTAGTPTPTATASSTPTSTSTPEATPTSSSTSSPTSSETPQTSPTATPTDSAQGPR